ncbi:MAG TPA: DUF6348 family protein [Actinoplanes sp.]|jgi:hypothetical protein
MFSERPRPWDPAAGRPSDDQLMELMRSRLLEIAPAVAAGSRTDHGVLEGRGWSWLALPNHTGRPSHFDIGFTMGSVVIADCISGTGPLKDAVEQVLEVWSQTSAACFLELLSPGGSSASRPAASDPAGIAGWASVVSDVIGYGPDAAALRDALRERAVLGTLGLALPRHRPNGIKVYLHKTPAETTGEVRVNGVVDATASQALAAIQWPEVTAPTTARFYAVAVHPE